MAQHRREHAGGKVYSLMLTLASRWRGHPGILGLHAQSLLWLQADVKVYGLVLTLA